jgi:hypothetical protein
MLRFETILVDTNLLVLHVVGTIDVTRIASFKRTRAYDANAFGLLQRIRFQARRMVTTPHVLTECSNLIDFEGALLARARNALSDFALTADEIAVPARAAIHLAATGESAAVVGDDLDLDLSLERFQAPVVNFSHLRARPR